MPTGRTAYSPIQQELLVQLASGARGDGVACASWSRMAASPEQSVLASASAAVGDALLDGIASSLGVDVATHPDRRSPARAGATRTPWERRRHEEDREALALGAGHHVVGDDLLRTRGTTYTNSMVDGPAPTKKRVGADSAGQRSVAGSRVQTRSPNGHRGPGGSSPRTASSAGRRRRRLSWPTARFREGRSPSCPGRPLGPLGSSPRGVEKSGAWPPESSRRFSSEPPLLSRFGESVCNRTAISKGVWA